MVKEFKTIFETAREEGREESLVEAIKSFFLNTELSNRAIAAALDVSEKFVQTIR
jgi:hypothetical protein